MWSWLLVLTQAHALDARCWRDPSSFWQAPLSEASQPWDPAGCLPRASSGGEAIAGSTRFEPATGLELRWIPGGAFTLGCAHADRTCNPEEKPARPAAVGGFHMGRTDVPVWAYARCVQAGACSAPNAAAPTCNWGRRPDHPVNCADALQASDFCAWLGGRLPTAAEWEYAAKSGEDPIHPWGDAPVTGARGNLCDRRCPEALTAAQRAEWTAHRWVVTREDDGWPGTSPVGAYPLGATRWGLLDMVGNVWQWTATWFNDTELEIRGGSWLDGPEFLRNSERLKHTPRTRHIDIGFRCVWPGAPLGPLSE